MTRSIAVIISLALMASLTTGCNRQSSPPERSETGEPAAQETTWEQQVSLVQQGQSSEIRIAALPVSAEQWSGLGEGCENLEVLDIEDLNAPEQSLTLLAELPRLRQLRIGSPVGDVGLQELAGAESLRMLNLPQGEFTDAGLAELTALPHLELLRFHSQRVTDDGMDHIAQLPALRFLHLINVPITDAGLEPLDELHDLESFYLDGGNCTEEGLSRLLEELPDLHFHLDQLHLPGDSHTHPH